MSEVKRYECLLIEDAPRLQAILPQGAVVCSERTQMMVTAEDYATLEAEAQALREEVKNRTAECNGLHEMLRQEHDRTEKAREEVEALRARVVVPDGYALVPIELTRDMWVAVNKEDDKAYAGACDHGAQFDWLWQAAIDAAPRLNGKAVSEGLLRRTLEFIKATNYQGSIPLGLIAELSGLLGEGEEHE